VPCKAPDRAQGKKKENKAGAQSLQKPFCLFACPCFGGILKNSTYLGKNMLQQFMVSANC